MSRSRIASLISLAALLALAGCGDSAPAKAPGAPGGPPAAGASKKLGRKMPEFTPSGMKEDYKKCQELDGAVRASKKEDEQDAAKKALEDFLKEFPGRWEGKEVPAPEGLMYASLLQKCKLYPQAINQVKRWIEVAPDDNINYANAHILLIECLAISGDYSGAESTLKEASETVLKGRDLDRRGAEETIANAMLLADQLEPAANHFETLATSGFGDVDDAVLGVDCWLRIGKVDEALRFANRAADFIKEGRAAERAKQLLKQAAIVGKPAAGFGGAKWWQGTGGPVTLENLKGKVTVVFTWNMKSNLNKWFFERLNLMVKDYADKPVQFVGISRLANFDPINMCTKKDMTEEDELKFYEMWCAQYQITYPLAVGAKDDDALIDAWAGYVVPYFVVVGKDGVVTYMRTGKGPEHFAALREMVDKALKK